MSALRLVFAGTPEFAAHHLQALLDSHHQVVAVFTQPDRPAGRGKQLQASPVKQLALQHQLPVHQPEKLKSAEDQALLAQYQADVLVVVAYGLLLPKAVLDLPRLGCINVHASLLPRWRGAAPIQRAIEAGDTETGVTIMQMDVGLDTGDMLHKTHLPITPDETGGSLHDKLWQAGCPALITTLDQMSEGKHTPESQDDNLATYAHKLSKQEAQMNWARSAQQLALQVRAFNPFPVCFSELNGERLRVWQAEAVKLDHQAVPGSLLAHPEYPLLVACAEDALALTQVQLAGKKTMSAGDLMLGYQQKFQPGMQFETVSE